MLWSCEDGMAKIHDDQNTLHVKLNYRDSGDGKVSTGVDTEQVSKLQKMERV